MRERESVCEKSTCTRVHILHKTAYTAPLKNAKKKIDEKQGDTVYLPVAGPHHEGVCVVPPGVA